MIVVSTFLTRIESALEKNTRVIYSLLLLLLGFMTIGFNYTMPAMTQWDEVYYLPVVARYERNTFFMESHPPFGKLLMTLGDVLVSPNKSLDLTGIMKYDAVGGDSDESVKTDDLPDNYSFAGVRLVPVLAALLIPLVLMSIVIVITKKEWLGFVIGLFAVLDNAFVLQFRGAMLDSILLLLMLVSVFWMVKSMNSYLATKLIPLRYVVLSTLFTGLALSTKYNAVILLVPLAILAFYSTKQLKNSRPTLSARFERGMYRIAGAWTRFLVMMFGIALLFVTIFAIHFGIARRVDTSLKNNNGYFGSSEILKKSLEETGGVRNFRTLVLAVGSGINFTFSYHSGVAGFRACEDEARAKDQYCNGSLPWMWPGMGRTINFRWSQFATENNTRNSITKELYQTNLKLQQKSEILALLPDEFDPIFEAQLLEKDSGSSESILNESQIKTLSDQLPESLQTDFNTLISSQKTKYLTGFTPKASYYTLVGNPVLWLSGILGVAGALFYILLKLRLLLVKKQGLPNEFWWICGLVGVYSGYLVLSMFSSRILYLYHYFFGLSLSWILFGVVIHSFKIDTKKWFQIALSIFILLIVMAFLLFAPFTYSIPLSTFEFNLRNWAPWWHILKVTE